MAITFVGEDIPGVLMRYDAPTPEPRPMRVDYPGIDGQSELLLGNGGRPITLDVLLCHQSWTTADRVFDFLAKLDSKAGKVHGTLQVQVFQDARPLEFPETTFDNYQQIYQVMPDLCGGLFNGRNFTYFTRGVFRFWQISLKAAGGGLI